MSDLKARKELLLAKASLQRLQLRNDGAHLRSALASPANALALITHNPGKVLLFGAALLFLGRGRMLGFVRRALAAVSIARTAGAVLARFRAGRG